MRAHACVCVGTGLCLCLCGGVCVRVYLAPLAKAPQQQGGVGGCDAVLHVLASVLQSCTVTGTHMHNAKTVTTITAQDYCHDTNNLRMSNAQKSWAVTLAA